jgi:hypothetical protein
MPSMSLNRGSQRVYKAYVNGIPQSPRGIELRYYNNLLPILRWHGEEIIFYSSYDVIPENLLLCFYIAEKMEEATILKKVEARIEKLELLRTTSYR